jgi:hypothetical protein
VGGRGVLSIALAAWVRQLPLWLLKSLVVTECLQSGHLKVLKPLIIVMVQYLRPSSVVAYPGVISTKVTFGSIHSDG